MSAIADDAYLRQRILEVAASRMRDFGYKDVQPDDIMGEYVLRIFLKSILEDDDNVGLPNKQFQSVRLALLEEIASHALPAPAKRKGK